MEGALPAIYKLGKAAPEIKFKNAVKKQKEYDESRGKGVSSKAQEVFHQFKKMHQHRRVQTRQTMYGVVVYGPSNPHDYTP